MTNALNTRPSLPTESKAQHDYILLDASASMSTRWWESLDAIDSYVTGLKAKSVQTEITLATFTTNFGWDGSSILQYDIARQGTPETWRQCDADIPMWANSTPLYDAINKMVRELRDLDPPRCSILIVTDGEENASKITHVQAKALLDWCRARGWQITFLGCDFDNTQQARLLGADTCSSVGTSAKRLRDATSDLATKRAYHATHGTPMHFSDEERKRFGGYLANPGK